MSSIRCTSIAGTSLEAGTSVISWRLAIADCRKAGDRLFCRSINSRTAREYIAKRVSSAGGCYVCT